MCEIIACRLYVVEADGEAESAGIEPGVSCVGDRSPLVLTFSTRRSLNRMTFEFLLSTVFQHQL